MVIPVRFIPHCSHNDQVIHIPLPISGLSATSPWTWKTTATSEIHVTWRHVIVWLQRLDQKIFLVCSQISNHHAEESKREKHIKRWSVALKPSCSSSPVPMPHMGRKEDPDDCGPQFSHQPWMQSEAEKSCPWRAFPTLQISKSNKVYFKNTELGMVCSWVTVQRTMCRVNNELLTCNFHYRK